MFGGVGSILSLIALAFTSQFSSYGHGSRMLKEGKKLDVYSGNGTTVAYGTVTLRISTIT